MRILQTEGEIRAGIAALNPVARMAAQNLAAYLIEHPNTIKNEEESNKAFRSSVRFAMQQAEWDATDKQRTTGFLKIYGEKVTSVALSIVIHYINQSTRKRIWGRRWLGRSARLEAGVLLTSLFA